MNDQAAAYADFGQRLIRKAKAPPAMEIPLVQAFFAGRSDGFFVDVGANDPVKDSQSWHLEQLGWKGLLIEPLPECCARLRAQRRNPVVQVACSSRANHGRRLPLQSAGPHSTLEQRPMVATTSVDAVIEVDAVTLDSVLEQRQVQPGFELLSIDVEGHEPALFDGFSFARWKPRLVLLEDHVTHHEKHAYMKAQGYQLLMRTGLNSWYVDAREDWTRSTAARLEFLRKYWIGLWLRRARSAWTFRNR